MTTIIVGYSYYVVVANREGDVKMLMEIHDKRGRCEKRIGQFTPTPRMPHPEGWGILGVGVKSEES